MMPTLLQEAAIKAIRYAEAMCGGRCNSENNPCYAHEVADTLRTALAQQGYKPSCLHGDDDYCKACYMQETTAAQKSSGV